MPLRLKPLIVACVAVLIAACQTVQGTDKAAVDYNRAFAKARDEITLLNVLRAAARQPLQFSTISSVQGAVRSGASIRVPFINVIAGDRESISPEITVSARNPTVSITPLATREFVQGISRPLSPGIIDDLLLQGWPLDVVLGLTIGGVVCADGTPKLNSGESPLRDARFLAAFRNVRDFGFELGKPTPYAQLRMTGREALAAMREGAGEQRRIAAVTALPPGSGPADTLVELVTPGRARIKGIDFTEVCQAPGASEAATPKEGLVPSADSRQGGVLLRSVLGIFHYLGKTQAGALDRESCQPQEGNSGSRLLRIEPACPGTRLDRSHVVTTFEGRRYFIRRTVGSEPHDRTLETLSLLIYLVDLQTSETAVKASVPFIAISQP